MTTSAPQSNLPNLAWSGTEYGVIWQDYRDGNSEIYFTRLNSNGAEIGDDTRITFTSSTSGDQYLAWSGSEYAVTWYDNASGAGEVYFTRVSDQGLKIGGDIRISYGGQARDPSIVWSGSEFGMSWEDMRNGNFEIYFARLDSEGNTIGADQRLTLDSNSSNDPQIVFTGSEYGITFIDNRNFFQTHLFFMRVSDQGVKIGSETDIIITNTSRPDIAWTGSEFGIVCQLSNTIFFTRVSDQGVEIGDETNVSNMTGNSYYPNLAWTGTEYGLTWENNDMVYLALLSSSGQKISGNMLATDPAADVSGPSMALAGANFGIAFGDWRNSVWEIYFNAMETPCP